MPQDFELEPDLAVLVEAIRLPTESIWNAHPDDNATVSILLIDDSKTEHANRMIQIGLAGGEGRSFVFKKANGVWSIASNGHWIG